jgi:hypothetical protein
MKLMTPNAQKVTRHELSLIPAPPSTDTHKPLRHSELINALDEALAFRHIEIKAEEYCIAKDGMRLFGLLEVNAEYEGIRFALGIRNANDKSMRLGIVAGYRVMVCSNMAFSGDFKPMLAKHTKHMDLVESLSIGVDRIQRSWQPLREKIDFMRGFELPTERAQSIIYRAFTEGKFPLRMMKSVHSNYFLPRHEEFSPRTVWSLSNAFTSALKEAKPDRQYELTAKLGAFLAPYTQAF